MNPYAPPTARVEDSIDVAAAEATRREHIAHETCVRAVGLLGIGAGALMLLRCGWILVFGMTFGRPLLFIAQLVAPLLFVTGALSIAAGLGVMRLRPWARVIAVALAVIGLLVALVGVRLGLKVAPFIALISACFLYVLFAAKGRRLFAPDYADIVAATSRVSYQTSPLLWFVLAIVVSVSGAFIAVGP